MAFIPTPILDHIVILIPHETLNNLPTWLTEAFTISPGGRHADGVTENKLVLFQDGVYLELISFIPGQEDGRKSHNWGGRKEGHIVDWANSLPSEDELEVIRQRVAGAKTGISYAVPKLGGRVRPDGVELKWVTCSPQIDGSWASGSGSGPGLPAGGFVGGEAPFWCLDRTPRDLRVPYHDGHSVTHPSGALGVRDLSIFVRDAKLFSVLKGTYDALQGQDGEPLEGAGNGFSWDLQVPELAGNQTARRTLSLIQIDQNDVSKGSLDVYVKLSLLSSASSTTVGGSLGDKNWAIEFDLKKS